MGTLPEGEREVSTSNYMKFEQGDNTFRILSEARVGLEYWKTVKDKDGKDQRKPFRIEVDAPVPMGELEVNPKTGELDMPKYFWAFVVWNYDDKKVQILVIKQATIREVLRKHEENKKWGDLRNYDITVNREGEGFDTKYTVMPDPDKTKIDEGITQLAKDQDIDLEVWFKGDDPFKQNKEEVDENDIPEDLGK